MDSESSRLTGPLFEPNRAGSVEASGRPLTGKRDRAYDGHAVSNLAHSWYGTQHVDYSVQFRNHKLYRAQLNSICVLLVHASKYLLRPTTEQAGKPKSSMPCCTMKQQPK